MYFGGDLVFWVFPAVLSVAMELCFACYMNCRVVFGVGCVLWGDSFDIGCYGFVLGGFLLFLVSLDFGGWMFTLCLFLCFCDLMPCVVHRLIFWFM